MKSQGDHCLSAVCPHSRRPESFTEVWGLDRSYHFVAQTIQDVAILVRNPTPVHSTVASFAFVLRSRSFQVPMVVERNGKNQSCNAKTILRAFRWGETEYHASCSVGEADLHFPLRHTTPLFLIPESTIPRAQSPKAKQALAIQLCRPQFRLIGGIYSFILS